jgi:adenylate kinase family enzyme
MLHLAANSTVVVIGPPGSGKTTVGKLLAETSELPLYSTDTYLGAGHVEALYAIMQLLGDEGWIVEGMIGYRLLRKRKQLRMTAPDIVIQLDASDRDIAEAYRQRGTHCDIAKVRAFCKAHETVLDDYVAMDGDMPRVWIHSKSPHLCHLIGGGPQGTARNDSSS